MTAKMWCKRTSKAKPVVVWCCFRSVTFILSSIPTFDNIFYEKMSKEKLKIFTVPENGEEKEPENPAGMRFVMIWIFEKNRAIVEKWGKEGGLLEGKTFYAAIGSFQKN